MGRARALHVVCKGDRVLSRVRGAVVRAAREVSTGEVIESEGDTTRLTDASGATTPAPAPTRLVTAQG